MAGAIVPNPKIPYGPERREWRDTVSRFALDPRDNTGKTYLVKPPYKDPIDVYPTLPDQESTHSEFQSKFQVPSSGLLLAQTNEANEKALQRNREYQASFIGYQVNPFFDYSHLKDFLSIHTNNVGDPFYESNLQTNTRWIERNVLDYYASLWNIDWPHVPRGEKYTEEDKEAYWGYCLTMGSTEGNMYGLWTARDYVSGKELELDERCDTCTMVQATPVHPANQNALEPVIFYSVDAHYSLPKTVALEQIKTFYQVGTEKYPDECPLSGYIDWPSEVPSTGGPHWPGTVDIEKLKTLVAFFTGKGHTAIVVLNYGSTFKGAYDDVEKAGIAIRDEIMAQSDSLENVFEVCYDDDTRRYVRRLKVWVHVDGALGASFMNFLEMANKHGKTKIEAGPVYDFRLPFVCSITTSGHKWMGCPWPCGVFMTRSNFVLKPPSIPNYIGSPDTTFAGSRNAFSPLVLWNYISTHSYDKEVEAVLRCFDYLQYISDELHKIAEEKNLDPKDLRIHITPLALTIRFKEVKTEIIVKYSLGTETVVESDDKEFIYAHLFVMPSTTMNQIREFLQDLRDDDDPFNLKPEPKPKPVRRLATRKPLAKCLMSMPMHGRGYR